MDITFDIVQKIENDGPMSIGDYMGACAEAYYQRPHTIGYGGDFVTAPELTSLYGEILALWFVAQFDKMGDPQPITFVELGPGRGTLLCDMFGVFKKFPNWCTHINIHLLESSQTLKTQQKKHLDNIDVHAVWHNTWDDLRKALPPQPTFFVSNEFFDALPLQQYICVQQNVYLRQVDIVDNLLAFVQGPKCVPPPFVPKDDGIYEWNFNTMSIMQGISSVVSKYGGAFLMIDYGYFRGHGDTLQALHNGVYANPLDHLGASDITAHVDFGALKSYLDTVDLDVFMTTQGDFLTALGMYTHAAKQWASLNTVLQKSMQDVLDRLLSQRMPNHMGALFKVLGGMKFLR